MEDKIAHVHVWAPFYFSSVCIYVQVYHRYMIPVLQYASKVYPWVPGTAVRTRYVYVSYTLYLVPGTVPATWYVVPAYLVYVVQLYICTAAGVLGAIICTAVVLFSYDIVCTWYPGIYTWYICTSGTT